LTRCSGDEPWSAADQEVVKEMACDTAMALRRHEVETATVRAQRIESVGRLAARRKSM